MRLVRRFVLRVGLVLWAASASAQSIFDAVKTGTPEQVRALVARDASLVNAGALMMFDVGVPNRRER